MDRASYSQRDVSNSRDVSNRNSQEYRPPWMVDWLRTVQKEQTGKSTEQSKSIEEMRKEAAKIEKQIAVLEERALIQHAKPMGEQSSAYFGQMSTALEQKRDTLDRWISTRKERKEKIADLTSEIKQNDDKISKLYKQIYGVDRSREEKRFVSLCDQLKAPEEKREELNEKMADLKYDLATESNNERWHDHREKAVEWIPQLRAQKKTLDQKIEQFEKMGGPEEQKQMAQEIHQLVSQGNKMIQDIPKLDLKLGNIKVARLRNQESSKLDEEISELLDQRNALHAQIAHLASVGESRQDLP